MLHHCISKSLCSCCWQAADERLVWPSRVTALVQLSGGDWRATVKTMRKTVSLGLTFQLLTFPCQGSLDGLGCVSDEHVGMSCYKYPAVPRMICSIGLLFCCSVASSEQVSHGETCPKQHKLRVFNIHFQSWNRIIFQFFCAFSLLTDAMSCSCPRPCSGLPDLAIGTDGSADSELSSVLDKCSVSNEVLSSAASINCCCRATSACQKRIHDSEEQNWQKIYIYVNTCWDNHNLLLT